VRPRRLAPRQRAGGAPEPHPSAPAVLSPELNPIENVWEYLRKNQLCNRLYADYREIVDACCDAWNHFVARPELVASVTARAWDNVS
jgi:hypothetical protein